MASAQACASRCAANCWMCGRCRATRWRLGSSAGPWCAPLSTLNRVAVWVLEALDPDGVRHECSATPNGSASRQPDPPRPRHGRRTTPRSNPRRSAGQARRRHRSGSLRHHQHLQAPDTDI